MGPLLRLHDKEGEGCGRVVGGGLGRAEGPGPCVVRSRLLLPQVRPAQWYVAIPGSIAAMLKIYNREINSEPQGRAREGGGRGGPGEGGGSWALRGEVSAPFSAGAPSSVVCMRPSM